jgi:hypothetical protein
MAVAAVLVLAGCGGGQRQDASEPSGNFPVDATASFPATQHVAGHTQLLVTVRNTGNKTIPALNVVICNVSCTSTAPGEGTSSANYANQNGVSFLAHSTLPVWVVDRPPDQHGCGYSCASGGAGGAASANANTWSIGQLPPGRTATFRWKVTALQPGHYTLAWQVEAGLNGKARAVVSGGGTPQGTLPVSISGTPVKSYVDNAGHIVGNPQVLDGPRR